MYDSSETSKNKDKDSTIVPEKKKRGRKPKKKDPANVVVTEKKKRGRKPKKKDSTNVVVKEKKKRGRKPASQVVTIVDNNSTNTVKEDECIITHFPISMNDIDVNKISKENSDDLKSNISDSCDSIFIKASVKESDKEGETSLIKQYEKKIKELNEKLKSLNPNLGIKTKKVIKTKLKFNYIEDGENKWMDQTDVHCWWCCHKFETSPISIPEKIYKDTYHVFGCFCSFNCAASYNINMNDYKIWERLTLLKSIYMKIYNKDVEILPAPPRKTLKIFGGHLGIEEFRSNILNLQKEYIYLIPPMISMTPLIEETSRISNSDNNEKFVPSYSSNNIKLTDKLMRRKPINNAKYSLVKTMGLKKKSAKKKDENDFFI
jgi:hypothetical protein